MSLRATVEAPVGRLDLFDLHRAQPQRYPFLLQSVAGHPQSGRYDVLFAFPGASLVLKDGELRGGTAEGDFFSSLDTWVQREATPAAADEGLPFVGGWFLYLGYEAGQVVEPRVAMPSAGLPLPDALAVRCPAAVIRDRLEDRIYLVAEQDDAQIQQMQADIAALLAQPLAAPAEPQVTELQADPPERFVDGVQRIIDYLRAGDVFQVNLSRAWRAQLATGTGYPEIYDSLRRNNPAPFAGLMCWEDAVVVSSSPERLAQIDGQQVQTRPIAGTRPRGADDAEDLKRKTRLIENLKERAEHVMLIDLERNDLGRVCEPGSVEVSELMTVESYAHVHHIVSNVRGRLREGAGPGAVLRAVFPGGTITGCPKVRAMQVIAELEGVGRGPYTGSMGYLNRDGRMDTNILIRSLAVADGQVTLRAGAGIVADSQPEFELREAAAKARGLLLALGAEV